MDYLDEVRSEEDDNGIYEVFKIEEIHFRCTQT